MAIKMTPLCRFAFWGCVFSCCVAACAPGRDVTYPKVIERAVKDKHSFVLFSGIDTFAVTSALVGRREKQFTVHLAKMDSLHRALLVHPGFYRQVRLYLHDSVSYTLDEPHTIPLARVAKIEVVDRKRIDTY